ncbi:MAG: NAD(P)-binding domain-containing protein [Propionibacteriaceae bacterium]|nr:NAD(P)-binding domain-containing protein [Propionibacteriaceae bacterium]
MSNEIRTVGILGAGRVGTAIARKALQAGYDVMIATSKPAGEISLIVEIVMPGARAVEAAEAAAADLVIVAVPLHKYRTLNPDMLAGKTVIDVMNYWAPIDGEVDDFENDPRTSSEVIQGYLGAKVVKTFNHIGYHEIESDGREAGDPLRRALALATDHDDARAMVSAFIERLGFDPVDAGPLSAGRAYQPGTRIFNGAYNEAQLGQLLKEAPDAAAA